MRRHILFVLLAMLAACEFGSPNNVANNTNGYAVDGTLYDESLGALPQSLVAPTAMVHVSSIEYVRAATDGFTAAGSPSDAAVAAADGLFELTIDAHLQFIVACHTYAKDAAAMGVLGQGLSPDGTVTRRQPLLFAVAGVALMAVAGYGYISNMYNERAKPVAARISDSTDAEHTRIKVLLALPPEYSREQTLQHFNTDIGFIERNNKVQEIEADFTASNEADIRVFGAEVNDAVANTAVRAGDAAVNLVVSGNTAAAGGQGYGQVAEHVGGTSTFVAEAIDFTISAISTATGEPLQPLDFLSAKLNTLSVSEKRQEVLVPAPSLPMSVPEAREIVETSFRQASVQEVDAAVATLIDDILTDLGDLPDVSDAGNGYRSVKVPQTMHITEFRDVNNKTTFQQLDLGTADVLVVAEGFRAQSFDDVNVRAGGSLEYYVDVDVDGPSNNATPNNNVTGDQVTVPETPWNGLQIELTVEGADLGTSRTDGDIDTNRFLFENAVLTGDTLKLSGTLRSLNTHSGNDEMAPKAEGDLLLYNASGDQVPMEWTSGGTTGNWTQTFQAEIDTTGELLAGIVLAVSLDPDDTSSFKTLSIEAQLVRDGVQRN